MKESARASRMQSDNGSRAAVPSKGGNEPSPPRSHVRAPSARVFEAGSRDTPRKTMPGPGKTRGLQFRENGGIAGFNPTSLLLAVAAMLMMGGCAGKGGEEAAAPRTGPLSYEAVLARERSAKDESFRSGAQSPLTAAGKAGFKGLNYYPPDPGLRFHLRLNRYPLPQKVRIGTNTGEIRTGLRYGYFEFDVAGKGCRLQVYRLDDAPAEGGPSLFIPFRDATSGIETYGAGRYIDLRENTSGMYDLDFNYAYNPYCAYEKSYSCPVPPEENRLGVPIRAGERNYEEK